MFRYQQVFEASEFEAVPNTHQTIIGLALRPDRSVRTPRTINYEDILLQLSTTAKSGSDLDVVFDNNVGDDVVDVMHGAWSVSTQATGPAEGPRGFDYYYPFERGFSYDPNVGRHLLLDVTTSLTPDIWDDVYVSDRPQSVFAEPLADTGITLDSGFVAQFVFSVSGIAGDYDGNGQLGLADVDLLIVELNVPEPSSQFDANGDGSINQADLKHWVKELKKTWVGDANLDGEFNSGDLVDTFSAGKYEVLDTARWGEGDWDGDRLFTTSDMVAAFADGGFERGPFPLEAMAVPEPTVGWLALAAMASVLIRRLLT